MDRRVDRGLQLTPPIFTPRIFWDPYGQPTLTPLDCLLCVSGVGTARVEERSIEAAATSCERSMIEGEVIVVEGK